MKKKVITCFYICRSLFIENETKSNRAVRYNWHAICECISGNVSVRPNESNGERLCQPISLYFWSQSAHVICPVARIANNIYWHIVIATCISTICHELWFISFTPFIPDILVWCNVNSSIAKYCIQNLCVFYSVGLSDEYSFKVHCWRYFELNHAFSLFIVCYEPQSYFIISVEFKTIILKNQLSMR